MPFPPMRVLEMPWSRALSPVCDVSRFVDQRIGPWNMNPLESTFGSYRPLKTGKAERRKSRLSVFSL